MVDQFGNLRNLDNTTVVTAARAAGSGTLQGTLTRTAVFGVASYTNLSMNVAGTITIQFTATNLTSVTSAPIVVDPAPADRLVFTTQPGSASAGVPFGIQPVLKTQDRFGSFSSAGLPASKLVTVTLTSGSGTLSGTKTLDIGSAAGNGTVAFTDLQIDAAGTGKQLTATSSGLTNAVSATFAVSSAVFSKLQLLVPGETAAPGTASGQDRHGQRASGGHAVQRDGQRCGRQLEPGQHHLRHRSASPPLIATPLCPPMRHWFREPGHSASRSTPSAARL